MKTKYIYKKKNCKSVLCIFKHNFLKHNVVIVSVYPIIHPSTLRPYWSLFFSFPTRTNLKPLFLKIRFNTILPSITRSWKWFFPSDYVRSLVWNLPLSRTFHKPLRGDFNVTALVLCWEECQTKGRQGTDWGPPKKSVLADSTDSVQGVSFFRSSYYVKMQDLFPILVINRPRIYGWRCKCIDPSWVTHACGSMVRVTL